LFFSAFPFFLISFLTYLLALKPFVWFFFCICFYRVLLYCWCFFSSFFIFLCVFFLSFFFNFSFGVSFLWDIKKKRGKTKMARSGEERGRRNKEMERGGKKK
jgi:hypothetical protein